MNWRSLHPLWRLDKTGGSGKVAFSSVWRVEMLDKDEHGSHNAGGHPWSAEPGVTSTLVLFNGEATPQKANLRFGTAGGPWMKRYTLAPHETRAIGINQLVDASEADDSGHALTVSALSGEFGWQADSTRLSGRVLESNPSAGMARSFSCSQWIYACSFAFSPNPSLLLFLDNTGNLSEVPDWAIYTGFHPPTSCSCANPSSGNTTLYNSWSSGNTSIAAITSGGTNTTSTWQGVCTNHDLLFFRQQSVSRRRQSDVSGIGARTSERSNESSLRRRELAWGGRLPCWASWFQPASHVTNS